MPAALDRIYRMNRIFSWADEHLNLNRLFVGDLTPQALPIRRSYFVNFVHSVQKILSLVALMLTLECQDEVRLPCHDKASDDTARDDDCL